MMNNGNRQGWKEYRFPDFVEIGPKVSLQKGSTYSFVEMADLQDGNKFCGASKIKPFKGYGTKFQDNDTLFARITPCLENGKICQVRNLSNGKGFGSTEFHVFRGRKGLSDTDFVFYLSRWPDVRNFAEANFHGTSGRQRVPRESFDNLFLTFPSLPEQHAIASVLSSLDGKIDLLHRQNKTLEGMAATLWRKMFVDDADPNWKKGKLGNYGKFKNGINYSRNENGDAVYSILNVRDIVECKYVNMSNFEKVNINESKATQYLLEKGDIVIVRSASPGESLIVLEGIDALLYSGFSIRLRCYDKTHALFIFQFLQSYKKEMDIFSDGTTLKNINQEILNSIELVIPGKDAVKKFNDKVFSIYNKIMLNQGQIRTLSRLRDTLLPKLMNGEVTVS